jgi:thiamine phosphate synthase YjbQ (UPF0047 family)
MRRRGRNVLTSERKGVHVKSHRKELWFNLPQRRGFVNITPEVQKAVAESGVQEGLVLCNAKAI